MIYKTLVSLDEVLALIPNDDLVGPKPSRLKEEITNLKTYGYLKLSPEDTPHNCLMEVIEYGYQP